ncbi:alpha/beta hydrolase family protein [Sphingomonas mali]|uniref:alpha/beta hydrolase family protein n=1 Tax=Sphingomonas mali TaxID=40682 RepID=UPI0008317D24|nr:alpha/beta hydrolase [Sphingomonas mali]
MPVEALALGWMRKAAALLLALAALHALPARAQLDGNFDETKVAPYRLPDPLVMANGVAVRTAQQWRSRRRPELVALFEHNIYGVSPPRPPHMRFAVTEMSAEALGGLAVRKQVTIYLDGTSDGPQMSVLIYLPKNARGPVPMFVGPNFHGNQSVSVDPAIAITPNWVTPAEGINKNRATLHARGIDAAEWPIERMLNAGYGVATYFTGDLYPDGDTQYAQSILPWYRTSPSAPDHWGAVAVWAWGLSRVYDYLATDRAVDAKRVIVIGHSRYGKAALWAGARDTRFAAVISNDSGEGGASLFRRNFGETIRVMNNYWFAPNYKTFSEREAALPVDAHELIALIAPRPVYIGAASEDLWADPLGMFLAAKGAEPVYRLLGVEGMAGESMPPPGGAILSRISYHLRVGAHGITLWDWDNYLHFADRFVRPQPR